MGPYVFVTMYRKLPTLRVSYREGSKLDGKTKNYPLTAAGCRQAGRDIFKSGAETWMNSSSVDFPQEVKKGCRLDVRELMSEGFTKALEEHSRPQKELVGMILTHCEKPDFQKTLTPKQQALFKVIAEKTRKGE
jgi:hypothetical protein